MRARDLIGDLIIFIGIVIGIWLSLWVLLAGGILQVVQGINIMNNTDIVIGILRILFSEAGMIPAYIGWLVGFYIKCR